MGSVPIALPGKWGLRYRPPIIALTRDERERKKKRKGSTLWQQGAQLSLVSIKSLIGYLFAPVYCCV
jgi:hypothetical protein